MTPLAMPSSNPVANSQKKNGISKVNDYSGVEGKCNFVLIVLKIFLMCKLNKFILEKLEKTDNQIKYEKRKVTALHSDISERERATNFSN